MTDEIDFEITQWYSIEGIPNISKDAKWQFVGYGFDEHPTRFLFQCFGYDLWIDKDDLNNYTFTKRLM